MSSRWWSLHTHSRKSRDDALPSPTALVDRAVQLGQVAQGLTDHGNVGGVVEHYTAAKKAGIAPFPGQEIYLVGDHANGERSAMHLTVVAYTAEGYRNLVGLNNLAQRNWHFRNARVDFSQLAGLAEDCLLQGLAIGTGCRSGPVVKALTERGPQAAEQVVQALARWFPRVYVELMDHGFRAEGMWDNEICAELLAIAQRQSLPLIITSDTHYTDKEHTELHDALKTLVVHQGVEIDERKFSGEGYWLVDDAHMQSIFEPEVFDEACRSLADLADANTVAIPELDTFTLKIPDVTFTGRQLEVLTQRSKERLRIWLDDQDASPKLRKEATERLDAELEVIDISDTAGYLLLVMAITDYCWENRIWFYTRGSATGSFTLFVNGVTQENPLPSAHDIRFDRFLSPDRTSMPDVDLDIEHERRDEVVQHFSQRYPALQVGTTMTYGITSEEDDQGEQKGSLAVKYYSVQSKLGTGIQSWADIPPGDKEILKQLSDMNLVYGRGAHSGGYVFGADEAAISFMPLEWINSSSTMVTAVDKDDVERMGLPKIDLLGSRVLTALRICCDLIVQGDGREYYASIPMNDKDTLKRCAAGKTVGTFQFGGWTNRKVMQQYHPTKVKDLIAIQALARPAPMKSGFTKSYMRRRDKAEAVPQMHDDIMAETKETYGLAIYQEQLVGVLRRLGLEPIRLTKLLKAVKASGKQHAAKAAEVMAAEIEPLKELAASRGWNEQDIAWLTSCLYDYGAGYSFGKAHSVQYGCTGYRTAYLAQHESLAYWTGMLNAYIGAKDPKTKEPLELRYKAAARTDGVKVLPPHVHHSGLIYEPDPENYAVREGLTCVPYVGEEAAATIVATRPYTTLIDLAQRVSTKVTGAKDLLFAQRTEDAVIVQEGDKAGEHRVTVLAQLHKVGALGGIPHGEPMRKPKGRKRKCEPCKITFPTPLEYEDHVDEVHPTEGEP